MIRYAMYGPCGVKRKFDEVEGAAGMMAAPLGTYIEQRQTLLDISMYKLRPVPGRRTEPSLRRSVLIYNTLRVIENELQAEGVAPNPMTPGLLFPPLQACDDVSEMTLDPLPPAGADHPQPTILARPECPPSPLPTVMDTSDVAPIPRAVVPPFCTSTGPPPPLPPCPVVTEAPLTPAPLAPTSPPHLHDETSSSSSCSSSGDSDEEIDSEPVIIHTLQPVTNAHKLSASSVSAATTTVCTPAAQALLNHDSNHLCNNSRLVSTSSCPVTSSTGTSVLFDLDSRTAGPHPSLPPCTTTLVPRATAVTQLATATPPHHAVQRHLHHHPGQVDIFGDIDLTLYDFDLLSSFTSNVKMAPLSAEELMHSFPADSPPPTLSSPSPCFRNELLNDDLDHIMQVLVGI